MASQRVMQFVKVAVVIVLAFLLIQVLSKSLFCNGRPAKESFADLAELENQRKVDEASPRLSAAMGASTDLLPKQSPPDEQFADFAPRALEGQNFLDATKFIGVDSIGTTNRNGNRQIRADPPIPRENVSIWSQSSYDNKDDLRKPLE